MKNLPIQFFEKRKDYDDRLTEGGGDSKLPSWVLSGESLVAHAQLLDEGITLIFDAFKQHNVQQSRLPFVALTTINDNALAKSHRNDICSLFARENKSNIIGFSGNKNLLSVIYNEQILTQAKQIMQKPHANAKLISSIEKIKPFEPFKSEYDENEKYYKVRLINYNNFDMNRVAKIIFEEQCVNNGIKIAHSVKYTQEITIYRVEIDSIAQMEILESFEGIYLVEKMLPIAASLDALSQEPVIEPKTPIEGANYPVVGILDTGIAKNSFLATWRLEDSHTNYPAEYKNESHGTFVSGIIEYGDELNDTKFCTLQGVRLFDATVYPDDKKASIYPDDLIEHIREAVERNNDIKIWNLSLGTNSESDLDEFSDFGMALDNIQDENNVLIIKSTGNCKNYRQQHPHPKSRIAKSADSIRSLVIGSIAEKKGIYDYAEPNEPSPFTRIGPGPSSIVKPDLVFYGGNAGVHKGKEYYTGVSSLSPEGKIITNVGTSFSTPRVTRMAAELMHLMEQEFDPLLIRALMIHNAKYPSGCKMNMTDKITQMGFGMPTSVQEMLYNSSDEVTLILRDTLDRGMFIEMFDFPFPASLVDEQGFFKGQVFVTLVTKSLVDDKQAGEYCQSNIDVLFGTYEVEKDRDTSKPTIKNPKGIEFAQNILQDSCYSSRAKGIYPMTGFERECTLVKYGKKFHPVKKYAVDLSDMTPSNKERFLSKKRKWYLKIEGLYRDFIERNSAIKDYQLSQEYCLLLTIRDPDGIAPVYDEVSQQLDSKNFIHHNINLRNVVTIEKTY